MKKITPRLFATGILCSVMWSLVVVGCYTNKEKQQIQESNNKWKALDIEKQFALNAGDIEKAKKFEAMQLQLQSLEPMSIGQQVAMFAEQTGVPWLSGVGAVIFSLYQMEKRKRYEAGWNIVTTAIEPIKEAKMAVQKLSNEDIGDHILVNRLLKENDLGPLAKK